MPLGYWRLRKIIPATMKTQMPANRDEARQRTLWLYRLCLRHASEIQSLYPLDVPVFQIRRRMREEFEKNRYVDNLNVINTLLMKGQAEFEETIHMWKTANHVMKYFKDAEDVAVERQKSGGFLAEFYSQK